MTAELTSGINKEDDNISFAEVLGTLGGTKENGAEDNTIGTSVGDVYQYQEKMLAITFKGAETPNGMQGAKIDLDVTWKALQYRNNTAPKALTDFTDVKDAITEVTPAS